MKKPRQLLLTTITKTMLELTTRKTIKKVKLPILIKVKEIKNKMMKMVTLVPIMMVRVSPSAKENVNANQRQLHPKQIKTMMKMNQQKKLASLEHTVYVEGIPFDCTEDEVRDFFVSNGIDDILQLRLPRWQDSGRLRGYGHVVFESEASQAKAVKDLSGRNLKRRYLTIQQAKAPRPDTSMGVVSSSGTNKPRTQPEGCKTIFIKNLPYNATEEDIQDVFRQCGKILIDGGVRIARNYETRQSKGFAYVEYKNPEGAYGAVHKAAKGDMKVLGRPCFVDYDEGSMKGSFKTKDGRLWSREHKPSRGHNTDKRLKE
mmetsp:Transcript_7677/g.11024  ORF Transcript_7677/g.11024 Transcript_7677/m.11024 type:complete len:316 (-) Transcript_7677:84-1031(-)